jgi:hypothetical protein
MRIGPLSVVFHRTVRVAEGRTPANLPPSLGQMKVYEVSAFKNRCPETWEESGVFVGLHDQEAMWLSFHASMPIALLVGAGSINAINGKKLGTKLEPDNYMVVPPQPWLDGWKSENGTVYQFVSTAYKKGEGNTVAEQLIGAESKTGGLGFALFEPKEPLLPKGYPTQGWGDDPYEDVSYDNMLGGAPPMASGGPIETYQSSGATGISIASTASAAPAKHSVLRVASAGFKEMGLGKGGQIKQKIYQDPYGLDKWRELPTQTRAVYIVAAPLLAEITGEPIQKPAAQPLCLGPSR